MKSKCILIEHTFYTQNVKIFGLRWEKYTKMRMTTAYKRISQMDGRYRICQGGMRAGKTFAILQYLIAYAETAHSKVISVVSSTLPALRLGAIRDFNYILSETGHYLYFEKNLSTLTWKCKHTGSVIEFVGLDGSDGEMKARGASRDVLFVNEANRMNWDTFKQLSMRTAKFIFLDFNPSARFWVHDKLQDREDASFEVYTYKDNEEIPKDIKDDIEKQNKDSNWWRVYGLGLIGELEGNVFKGWNWIDEYDKPKELIGYGLDFGFYPDPSALVAFYNTEDGLLFEEIFAKTGLTGQDLIYAVQQFIDPDAIIVCDNARPEIIAEFVRQGLNAIPCIKAEKLGKENIGRMWQISRMAEFKFTAVGKDFEREYLAYSYRKNRLGEFESIIEKGNDHYIDASRYIWFWWHRRDMINNKVNDDLKEYL